MYSKLKRFIINILIITAICSLNVACNNKNDSLSIRYSNISKTDLNNMNNEINIDDNQLITADEFMDFYEILESEVPSDYVDRYIWEYRLPRRIMQDDVDKMWRDKVILAYKSGKSVGEKFDYIFHGPESDLELEEFMNNVDFILIDFNMYYGNEYYTVNKMAIDFLNKEICFTTKNFENYKDFEKRAILSEEEVKKLREELPKHIIECDDHSNCKYNSDYSFQIKMKANDYSTKSYYGNSGDDTHYPGFDEFWNALYERVFGKKFNFAN